VLILKEVKVACFVTLLQVLILKDMVGRLGGGREYTPKEDLFTTELAEGAEIGRAAKAGRARLGWPKLI
jgi:hypothetical protein